MKRRITVLAILALSLAACGGGGGHHVGSITGNGGGGSIRPEPTQPATETLPAQRIGDARQSPLVHVAQTLHVGADVSPPLAQLNTATTHGNVVVRTGDIRDGFSSTKLIEFLTEDMDSVFVEGPYQGQPASTYHYPAGPAKWKVTPTIHLEKDINQHQQDIISRATQMINASLPFDRQVLIADDQGLAMQRFTEVVDRIQTLRELTNSGAATNEQVAELYNLEKQQEAMEQGKIFLRMREGYGGEAGTRIDNQQQTVVGDTNLPGGQTILDNSNAVIAAGYVDVGEGEFVDGNEERALYVVIHELIHALGYQHAPGPISIMNYAAPPIAGHILYPMDRELIHAMFSGLDIDDFGPWSDSSMHIRGDLSTRGGPVTFGVSTRNGLSRPWAYGVQPELALSDNSALVGGAGWFGRLLGITRRGEPVGGEVSLTVNLMTLDGNLSFTNLEHWAANAMPGAVGSGRRWGDGDLRYTVGLRGNSFVQTGGDAGIVTGAFFGAKHEGIGGTLQRRDLKAAFGGAR